MTSFGIAGLFSPVNVEKAQKEQGGNPSANKSDPVHDSCSFSLGFSAPGRVRGQT